MTAMEERPDNDPTPSESKGFSAFVIKRIFAAMIVIAVLIYGLVIGIDYLQKAEMIPQRASGGHLSERPAADGSASMVPSPPTASPGGNLRLEASAPQASPVKPPAAERQSPQLELFNRDPSSSGRTRAPAAPESKAAPPEDRRETPQAAARDQVRQPETPPATPGLRPPGVAFVEAVIKPLDYELNHRFWGWRPNDFINLTDNVNNFQLGVLEVTRRTVVQLAERISRTGYNDAFDRDLENAMNWLMIKATSYWFPAPETKYKESIAELANYKQNLINKKAYFYTRSDNLIPLLTAFEDLMGSCDTNLVKNKEADGSKVGFFKADDYFYYSKGVSSAMATILESVSHDFAPILSNRNAAELLHKAIVSCRLASSLDPWIVTNGSLDGILANHRAHMAAPVSHARYYLGQLIKTLST
jgi:hypothetical protein